MTTPCFTVALRPSAVWTGRALLASLRTAACFTFALCTFSQAARAADVLVVTDASHPVKPVAGMRVIELDGPSRIEAELSANLPADRARAIAIVQQRLSDGEQDLQRRMAHAYQDVADAWSLGIAKLPAIVVDRRYVVYGETDVAHAVSRIEAYRGAHP